MVLHLLSHYSIRLDDWYNDFSEQDCADYHLSIAMETSYSSIVFNQS